MNRAVPFPRSVVVVGGGVFGAAGAAELARRGWRVDLIDPGPLPHPKASSTDVSKVIRMDYGADDFYCDLMAECLRGWDAWNARWERPLYHECGFLVLAGGEMRPGGFEYESFVRLRERGVAVGRIDAAALARRFPAWNAGREIDGYFNPRAGWAESGRVVEMLLEEAREAGARLHEGRSFGRLIEDDSRVAGVETREGERFEADFVVMAAGAWSPKLLPHLGEFMRTIGQPVVHFRAPSLVEFQPPKFSCWASDIGRTGWYGFPALDDGALKIGHHGPGAEIDPEGALEPPPEHIERCRSFLREFLPSAADAPVVRTRLCLYCDAWDGNFYIDHDPERPGLFVACGGSGHGFKFAPMLGGLIADGIEGRANRWSGRFAWRARGATSKEDARFAFTESARGDMPGD